MAWTPVSHKYEQLFALHKREGVRSITYRYRYRRDGVEIEGTLPGLDEKTLEPRDVKDVAAQAEKIISNKRAGEKVATKALVTSESLLDEIVKLKESKSDATREQTDIFSRVHMKPFLRGECAYLDESGGVCKYRHYLDEGSCTYAADLDATKWLNYKTHLRLHRPKAALFNHWKFWVMLFKHAQQKGLLKQKIKLDYDEEKEDFRAEGLIIPDADMFKILDAAAYRPVWHDRILFQRGTGARPGETRDLQKDRYNRETHIISLKKEDTKIRRARAFLIEDEAIIAMLERRLDDPSNPGPYFFPAEGKDRSKPMGKGLKGWRAILTKAGVSPDYTPHDLRHTYLTEMFKTSENPALICFQAGLSLEEATETYLHFKAEDTASIAKQAAQFNQRRAKK